MKLFLDTDKVNSIFRHVHEFADTNSTAVSCASRPTLPQTNLFHLRTNHITTTLLKGSKQQDNFAKHDIVILQSGNMYTIINYSVYDINL